MGLETIEADIRKKTEEKVNSTISDAKKSSGEVINKAKEQIFELKKTRALEIQKVVKEYREREIAQANLNARKLVLDAKREAIESLYAKIEERILQIGTAEKKEILKALIEKGKNELQGARYIFSNASDKTLVEGLASAAGLKFGGVVECKGGVIVESESREVRVDYTYESLLVDFRKNSIEEVASQLFGVEKK